MERILMKLEVSKSETLSHINVLFRQKVQYDEQVKDNEIQIHYSRGKIDGFIEAQSIIAEVKKAEEIEAMMEQEDHPGKVEELPSEVESK